MARYAPGALLDGRKAVAVAGTPERLSTITTEIDCVTVTAERDNTGTVTVGASTVVDSASTRRGTPLGAGDSFSLDINHLPSVWIDAEQSGDGVTWTAEAPIL